MTSNGFALRLFFLISLLGMGPFPQAPPAAAWQTPTDLEGTWSGTFFSKNNDIAPMTITVKISPNGKAHLIGDSTIASDCVKDVHRFEVSISGSNVVFAGSDEEGDSVTFKGTPDQSGTVLTMDYIVNASPSGRCETDQGTGTMGKR
jgi:hypothetical protein